MLLAFPTELVSFIIVGIIVVAIILVTLSYYRRGFPLDGVFGDEWDRSDEGSENNEL